MDLYSALIKRVSAFLRRESPLLELREWLEQHDSEVAVSEDEALLALNGDVWELLSEMDTGSRDQTGVAAELAARYPQLAPVTVTARAAPLLSNPLTATRPLVGIFNVGGADGVQEVLLQILATRGVGSLHVLAGSLAA